MDHDVSLEVRRAMLEGIVLEDLLLLWNRSGAGREWVVSHAAEWVRLQCRHDVLLVIPDGAPVEFGACLAAPGRPSPPDSVA